MKKFILFSICLILSVACFAQEKLAFPFMGGKEKMTRFFKDSLSVPQNIIQKKAAGVVIFKFSVNEEGSIDKIIIYFADDAILVAPVIDAIKKSNHKWVIPEHEKTHDFLMPVYIRYNLPENDDAGLQQAALDNYRNKRPIYASNQIPLDMATLLPAVTISYDLVL